MNKKVNQVSSRIEAKVLGIYPAILSESFKTDEMMVLHYVGNFPENEKSTY